MTLTTFCFTFPALFFSVGWEITADKRRASSRSPACVRLPCFVIGRSLGGILQRHVLGSGLAALSCLPMGCCGGEVGPDALNSHIQGAGLCHGLVFSRANMSFLALNFNAAFFYLVAETL